MARCTQGRDRLDDSFCQPARNSLRTTWALSQPDKHSEDQQLRVDDPITVIDTPPLGICIGLYYVTTETKGIRRIQNGVLALQHGYASAISIQARAFASMSSGAADGSSAMARSIICRASLTLKPMP